MISYGIHSCALAIQDTEAAIEAAARIGYDAFEIDVQPRVNSRVDFYKYASAFDAERFDGSGRKKQTGIPIQSLCLGVLWYVNLAAGSAEERIFGAEIVRWALERAEKLGASMLLLPVGTPFEYSLERARETLAQTLRPLAAEAGERGVTLGVENVCQRILWTAQELSDLVDAVGSPHCRAYYDVGNALLAGEDPVCGVRTLGKRIAQYHIKDMKILRPYGGKPEGGYGSRVLSRGDSTVWDGGETCLPMEGGVNWDALSKAVREVGNSVVFVNETVASEQDPEHVARAQLPLMRRFFG